MYYARASPASGAITYASRRGELLEDAAEQEVIQKAKDFQKAGLSLRKIAAELNKQGIKTRRGSMFAATQIQRMVA